MSMHLRSLATETCFHPDADLFLETCPYKLLCNRLQLPGHRITKLLVFLGWSIGAGNDPSRAFDMLHLRGTLERLV